MSGTILKWGIPALLTVVGGTTAAVLTSGAAIPPDLEARSRAQLADPAYAWAAISFDAQDATLSGTAPTQQLIDDATARVAEVHGVRAVESNAVVAEKVSPFPFVATVSNGQLTLSGGVPDEAARAELMAAAGQGAVDSLQVMSGAPDRAGWLAAARYVIDSARQLDEGEVALADLNLTLSGRARSSQGYEQLSHAAAPPEGVKLGFSEVQPPLASPFEWHARFDGTRLNLSGVTPSEDLATALTDLVPDGIPVSTSLTLASGAPHGFDESAKLLLQNLLKLENGDATISDSTASLDGSPADPAAAESVRLALTPSGAQLTLSAPRVAEYWLSAERSSAGIVLDGFVPDAAMRDRLEALDKVDAAGLELGRGAPERFESAVDFAIQALGRMSDGHATIQGTLITIEGRAATLADYTAAQKALQLGAPQGLVLGAATLKPPLATTFTFAAEKSADGTYALSGYVPTEEAHQALRDALPEESRDTLVLADGSPTGFEAAVPKALDVLALLDSGRVSYDGTGWSISGAVDTPPEALAAEQAFAATGLRQAGWSYEVALPKAAAAAALPTIEAYTWSAQKSAEGILTFSGYAPTEQFKRYVAVHAGDKVVDGSSLGAGAPDGFVGAALAGLDALLGLEQGEVGLSAGKWTLTGAAATTDARQALETRLSAAVDTSAWSIDLQAPETPVAETTPPEQPVEVELPATPVAEAPAPAEPAEPAPTAEEPPVQVAEATPAPETPAGPVVRNYVFDARKVIGAPVTFKGTVPADAMRRFLAVVTGTEPSDTLQVGGNLPADFIPNAEAGSRALTLLADGEFGLDGGKWVFTGRAETEADRQAALTALAVVPTLNQWQTDVTLLPPLLVCEQKVSAFQSRNAILFDSGSAHIADASSPAIDELAGYLALCPEATVNVEGHTDSDGEADANLALSVSRAEAVIDALIARGVSPDRLYAVGYGESLPVESNDTRAGKQANRRIAFTLADE